MEPNIEDLIGPPDDTPPPTEKEEIALWRRLFEMNLRGRRIEIANRGGDMLKISAVLEKVLPILGGGILAQVRSMTYTDESKEGNPIPVPEELILLSDWEPPRFVEDKNPTGRTIILAGALGTVLPNGDFVDYGTLDIGFIF